MSQVTDKHLLELVYLMSPINQPMADFEYVSQETKQPLSWFMKVAEASHQSWRGSGSQSYGLQ